MPCGMGEWEADGCRQEQAEGRREQPVLGRPPPWVLGPTGRPWHALAAVPIREEEAGSPTRDPRPASRGFLIAANQLSTSGTVGTGG